MRKWKEFWQESLPYEKVFHIAFLTLSGLCLILVVLLLCHILPDTLGLFLGTGLLALLNACDIVVQWRRSRSQAYWGIARAAFLAVLVFLFITQL